MIGLPLYTICGVQASGITQLDVDFTALSTGGQSASTFLSNTGLTFTRSTISTVQTSASTIDSTPGIDYACIGTADGTKKGLVIQHNTYNLLSIVPDNSPRNLTIVWTSGSGVTVTPAYAAGPDGITPGVGCSRLNMSSGGFGPYGSTIPSRACFSSWQRSVNALSNGDMMTAMNQSAINSNAIVGVRLASNTWGRIITKTNGVVMNAFTTADTRDYSVAGGQTARARDVQVDYVQLEYGDFATESIATAQTVRANDRLTYSSASSIIESGRVKVYLKFYPKLASTSDVFFRNAGNSGTSTAWYFWSFNGDGNNFARIDVATKKLSVKLNGGTTITSTNAISWSQYDLVEAYFEVGANASSVAKYRLNGGSWVDLVLATITDSAVPTGSFAFMHNDNITGTNTDTGQIPCWLAGLKTYGASGSFTG